MHGSRLLATDMHLSLLQQVAGQVVGGLCSSQRHHQVRILQVHRCNLHAEHRLVHLG